MFLGKRGQEISLHMVISVILAIAVGGIFMFAVPKYATSADFDRVFVTEYTALTINTLYSVPGDITYDYRYPLKNYKLAFREGRIAVNEIPFEQKISLQTYVEKPSYKLDKEFTSPSFLAFRKKSGIVDISDSGFFEEQRICPAVDTSGSIEEKVIYIDASTTPEKAVLVNEVALALEKACRLRNIRCQTTKPEQYDMLVKLDIGEKQGEVVIIYPKVSELSTKLSCFVTDELTNADLPNSEESYQAELTQTEQAIPFVVINIGSIEDEEFFSARNMNLVITSVVNSIIYYYKPLGEIREEKLTAVEYKLIGVCEPIDNLGFQKTSYYLGEYGSSQNEVRSNLVKTKLFDRDIYVNKRVAKAFACVQKEIEQCQEAGGYDIDSIGTYNWRTVRGSRTRLSAHSFGIAVDINPDRNPMCPGWPNCAHEQVLITDIPECVVQAFKRYGFEWGGDWQTRKDPMHFEYHGEPEQVIV